MIRGRATALAGLAALALSLWRLGPGDPLTDAVEARLYDLRLALRGGAGPSERVLVLAIDEPSLARIGSGAAMRAALAGAVTQLHADGAAVVAIDLMLVGPTGADAALVDALRAVPTVLAAAAVEDGTAAPPGLERDRALAASAFRIVSDRAGAAPPVPALPLALPAPPLAGAATALGHVNLSRDPDRVWRRIPLALPLSDGTALPALPLVAARLALGLPPEALRLDRGEAVRLGDRRIPTRADGTVLIDHAGPAGTLDRIALAAFLDGARPPGGIAGRVVVTGATAESLGDIGATPLDPDMPGPETLAAVIAQLLEGRGLDDGPAAALATLALAVPAAGAAALAALVPSVGLAALATVAVWAAAALLLQAALVWAGLVPDATALALALVAGSLPGWALGRQAERARARRLAPHVSPLLGHENGPDAPCAAVAFVDMVGSTTLGETLEPGAFGAALAFAHGRIAQAATRHGGIVAEILGDGAVVVFGLSGPPGAAARGALGFLRDVALDPSPPRLRATAHLGPVAVADLGAGPQRHLTLTGDTVNAAARLQDEARARGAAVVVSGALIAAAGGAPEARALGEVRLRGRAAPLAIYGLGD